MIRKVKPEKKKLDPMVVRRYLIILTIGLVVALTALNIWLVRGVKQEAVAKQGTSQAAEGYGKADIGGDFTMTNQRGERVSFSSTNGKLRLVFFGFTNCPDICPVSMLTLTNVMNTLGDKASAVQPVFITVDPARDTPEVMKEYVSNFHPSILALSGTSEETEAAAKAFKVYYSVQEKQGVSTPDDSAHQSHSGHDGHGAHQAHDGGHADHADHSKHAAHGEVQVDHSGFIYLLDRDGNYLAHFPHDVAEQKLLDALTPYLKP